MRRRFMQCKEGLAACQVTVLCDAWAARLRAPWRWQHVRTTSGKRSLPALRPCVQNRAALAWPCARLGQAHQHPLPFLTPLLQVLGAKPQERRVGSVFLPAIPLAQHVWRARAGLQSPGKRKGLSLSSFHCSSALALDNVHADPCKALLCQRLAVLLPKGFLPLFGP